MNKLQKHMVNLLCLQQIKCTSEISFFFFQIDILMESFQQK